MKDTVIDQLDRILKITQTKNEVPWFPIMETCKDSITSIKTQQILELTAQEEGFNSYSSVIWYCGVTAYNKLIEKAKENYLKLEPILEP